jgi:hypothetical protein
MIPNPSIYIVRVNEISENFCNGEDESFNKGMIKRGIIDLTAEMLIWSAPSSKVQ